MSLLLVVFLSVSQKSVQQQQATGLWLQSSRTSFPPSSTSGTEVKKRGGLVESFTLREKENEHLCI